MKKDVNNTFASHFHEIRFSKFWAVSCSFGFKVSKRPCNFFFTKLTLGIKRAQNVMLISKQLRKRRKNAH